MTIKDIQSKVLSIIIDSKRATTHVFVERFCSSGDGYKASVYLVFPDQHVEVFYAFVFDSPHKNKLGVNDIAAEFATMINTGIQKLTLNWAAKILSKK